MRHLFFALLLAPILVFLTGCPQLPRPFMHEGTANNPLLQPLGLRAIHVPPIADSAVGGALAQALVKALEGNEMAATLRPPAPGALVLDAEVAEEVEGHLLVQWTLREHAASAAGDTILATYSQPIPASRWHAETGQGVNAIAREVVAKLSRHLREEAPQEDPKAMPSVTLVLTEVPGDGPRSLMRAMITALRREGIAVVETGQAIVEGKVVLSPTEAPARENVRIAWVVRTPKGEELGVIEQKNVIPAGKLSGAWGGEAYLIAEGGAMGVAELLSRVKPKLRPPEP